MAMRPASKAALHVAEFVSVKQLPRSLVWLVVLTAASVGLVWLSFGCAWLRQSWVFYAPYALYTDCAWSRAVVFFVVLIRARTLVSWWRRPRGR
jgi:hypothetical protein